MATKYNGLPTHLRNWGLKVVERSGWQTRSAKTTTFTPIAVVCHHTAGPRTGNAPSLGYIQSGSSISPLAQFVLGRDGTVYIVSGNRANHAGEGDGWKNIPRNSANRYAWGIEAENVGTKSEPWTAAQLQAYYRLCAALLDMMGQNESYVFGHKEWTSRKTDPHSLNMDEFRKNVAAALKAGPKNTPAKPKPAPVTVKGVRVLGAGDRGKDVLYAQQRLVYHGFNVGKSGPDSIFGNDTRDAVIAFQKAKKLGVDGLIGPATLAALKKNKPAPPKPVALPRVPKFPGTTRRGSRGGAVSQVQARLKARGWKITVDGVFGSDTEAIIRQFQKEKGLKVDGIVGSTTWKALWTTKVT